MKMGEFNAAIEDFNKAIKLDPKHTNAYMNSGIAKDNLEKHAEAKADFDKAIAIDPDNALTYSNRGAANYRLEKYPEAIKDFSEAIEKHNKDDDKKITYLLSRSECFMRLQLFDNAMDDIKAALKINPYDMSALKAEKNLEKARDNSENPNLNSTEKELTKEFNENENQSQKWLRLQKYALIFIAIPPIIICLIFIILFFSWLLSFVPFISDFFGAEFEAKLQKLLTFGSPNHSQILFVAFLFSAPIGILFHQILNRLQHHDKVRDELRRMRHKPSATQVEFYPAPMKTDGSDPFHLVEMQRELTKAYINNP